MSNLRPSVYLTVCVTLIALAIIGAFVALELTHHSNDAFRVGSLVLTGLGSLTAVAGIQSVRNGIGRANTSLENGLIKNKVLEALQDSSAQNILSEHIQAGIRDALAARRSTDPPAGGNPPAGGPPPEGQNG